MISADIEPASVQRQKLYKYRLRRWLSKRENNWRVHSNQFVARLETSLNLGQQICRLWSSTRSDLLGVLIYELC